MAVFDFFFLRWIDWYQFKIWPSPVTTLFCCFGGWGVLVNAKIGITSGNWTHSFYLHCQSDLWTTYYKSNPLGQLEIFRPLQKPCCVITSTLISLVDALNVKVIVVGNGTGDPSSFPGRGCLRFTFTLMSLGKAWIYLFFLLPTYG